MSSKQAEHENLKSAIARIFKSSVRGEVEFKQKPKEEQLIKGVPIYELVENNKRYSYELGWRDYMDTIRKLFGEWLSWRQLTKQVYEWQKVVAEDMGIRGNRYFEGEWGTIGPKTLAYLRNIMSGVFFAATGRPEKEQVSKEEREKVEKKTPELSDLESGNVTLKPTADLLTPLLRRAYYVLDRVMPSGTIITSAYRSPKDQERIINAAVDDAVKHYTKVKKRVPPFVKKIFRKYETKGTAMKMKLPVFNKPIHQWSIGDRIQIAVWFKNLGKPKMWVVAPPGKSKHQQGKAMDIWHPNLNKLKAVLRRLTVKSIGGIRVTKVLDERSHIHVEFTEV
jgi:hypothetical protein